MPRGLGDSPLSKERKKRTRRAPSQVLATPDATVAPSAPVESAVDQSNPGLWTSTSSSSSYNDVFFQRRDESSGEAPTSGSPVSVEATQVVTTEATTIEPAATEPATFDSVASSIPVLTDIEPTPSASEAFTPEHIQEPVSQSEPVYTPAPVVVSEPEPVLASVPVVVSEPEPVLHDAVPVEPAAAEPAAASPLFTAPTVAEVEPQAEVQPERQKGGFFSKLFGRRNK